MIDFVLTVRDVLANAQERTRERKAAVIERIDQMRADLADERATLAEIDNLLGSIELALAKLDG